MQEQQSRCFSWTRLWQNRIFRYQIEVFGLLFCHVPQHFLKKRLRQSWQGVMRPENKLMSNFCPQHYRMRRARQDLGQNIFSQAALERTESCTCPHSLIYYFQKRRKQSKKLCSSPALCTCNENPTRGFDLTKDHSLESVNIQMSKLWQCACLRVQALQQPGQAYISY